MTAWEPKTFEDKLISHYAQTHGGLYFLEVPTGSPHGRGNWPADSGTRRIDAVRLVSGDRTAIIDRKNYGIDEFAAYVKGHPVELIEAKNVLNRVVFGQIVAGREMFQAEYGPESIVSNILCSRSDPALEWVCRRYSVNVTVFPEPA